ncbi:MAG: cytochrome b [Zetaproteobacteria bacterium CG06_land_8_20_14_3_00_59_53]|nr:MAG: cytochrome b [Zetaproteobacteria bacterium CG2_30_59_37]PIO89071.1 MAG: cytochrome b [Zetaproteobacteria bacterium CG23_combo_of_CG06-09_8_20_14_all_59_86]PIQ65721.1 MAG: cytochrome b [Zetaproteobacteria bacterium CG11_big_fil_rev_8_21_14_0_20_59_439]PIU70243.1 MAG: cytochrome b [Zetaproteobacteria bacterium CG06_land_8_20_14_3_00_59_53]PIU96541.1 MAG: cytochrome b [Zetaproteobacteria bacterium CG03_land_8_20_14_0_80_59_51]PIY46127.1 MAG: cytochrome b [Zetaproteobacteria bacterium CG_4
MNGQNTSIMVWDPLLRSFHWLLVVAFGIAWWSEGSDIRIHMLAGSVIPGLLFFRLIWGVAGEQHALFASLRPSLAAIRQHVIELLHLQADRYKGHTPIGSLMIYILLIVLLVLGISGMLLAALQMGLGPFAGWAAQADMQTEWLVMQLHGWCFDALQVLVAIHLAGVAAESVLQRCNLTLAMITGRKNLKEQQA